VNENCSRPQPALVLIVGVRLTGAEFWPSLGRFEDNPQLMVVDRDKIIRGNALRLVPGLAGRIG
jgi:hypothetical protein